MPLSISNSDQRIKTGDWTKTWVAVAVAVLLIMAGWEAFWRSRGFAPSIQDDWPLWAEVRRDAAGAGPQRLVTIGSSRIQVGFDPGVWQQAAGRHPLILAIDGSSPFPVLADLSADNSFRGTVLCSIIPLFLAEPGENGRAAKWVRKYHDQKLSSRLDTWFRVLVQQTFVWRWSGLLPDELWSTIADGRWPQPPYAPMQANRFRPADFSQADVQRIRAGRIEREKELAAEAAPLDPERFLQRVKRLNRMAEKIENRGGRVVFIRYPSTGPVRRIEERTWPRSRYWDVLARHSTATTIHFEDYPSLSGFPCPDGSHLGAVDARRFTRELTQIIRFEGSD